MRKQEFNSKLISLLPLDEVPVHVPLRRPRPLRFERLRVGGEGKADANLTNFLSTCCAWHPNSPPRPGEAPHPAPSARKSVIRLHRKLPSAPPGSTQEVSKSENPPATRGTAHSEVQGDARCTARCSARPMAALHFLLPTGHSRSGRRSLIPNISLLPLDEVPLHVHRFAARAPCDSKDSEWAAKEKPTPISQFFFSTCCALAPHSPPRP